MPQDPLTNKLPLQDDIERILFARALRNELEGFTLDTAHEIAKLVAEAHAPATPATRDEVRQFIKSKMGPLVTELDSGQLIGAVNPELMIDWMLEYAVPARSATEPYCETCDANDCECVKVNLPVAEAAPTTPQFPVGKCKKCGKDVPDAKRDGKTILFCSYECYCLD